MTNIITKQSISNNVSFGLLLYIFLFILLTLHSPYIFIASRDHMVLAPNGGINYENFGMGMIVLLVLFAQVSASVLIFVIIAILKQMFKSIDPFRISFFIILGFQAVVYANVYLSPKTKPEIVAEFGPFTISLLFLSMFTCASLYKLHKKAKRQNLTKTNVSS